MVQILMGFDWPRHLISCHYWGRYAALYALNSQRLVFIKWCVLKASELLVTIQSTCNALITDFRIHTRCTLMIINNATALMSCHTSNCNFGNFISRNYSILITQFFVPVRTTQTTVITSDFLAFLNISQCYGRIGG
jgi:hypothetical protein